ncbi:phospholipase A [Chitinilyticum aquatile]|uniref:phospholipase A n=1 Tax=Chitinilyticum aquatile TaxID=362520 RepID=UPI00138B04DB|nr:phospholipase A [Chitinilyticum aquatile]
MKKMLILAGLFGAGAHAADLATCQRIRDNGERLACYDALAREDSTAKLAKNEPDTTAILPQPATTETPLAAITPEEQAPILAGAGLGKQGDAFSQRWELDASDQKGIFNIRPHMPVYLLPVSWRQNVNRQPCSSNPRNCASAPEDSYKNIEAKFQLSFKTKLWEDALGSDIDLWAAYTQQSYWQVYDTENSSPFRETDYQPEVWATIPVQWGPQWLQLRMINLGLVHQSNGQTLPLSRSWNRAYASFGLTSGDLSVIVKPWWRLPEDAADDDNPDISDYSGRLETLWVYPWRDHLFSLTWRNNLKFASATPNRSYWQFEWAFPLAGSLHGYVQAFDGWGDSLQNYNFRNRGISAGISLVNWQ